MLLPSLGRHSLSSLSPEGPLFSPCPSGTSSFLLAQDKGQFLRSHPRPPPHTELGYPEKSSLNPQLSPGPLQLYFPILPVSVCNSGSQWLRAWTWNQTARFTSQLCHLSSLCPWDSPLTSLYLRFLISKGRIIKLSTLLG